MTNKWKLQNVFVFRYLYMFCALNEAEDPTSPSDRIGSISNRISSERKKNDRLHKPTLVIGWFSNTTQMSYYPWRYHADPCVACLWAVSNEKAFRFHVTAEPRAPVTGDL